MQADKGERKVKKSRQEMQSKEEFNGKVKALCRKWRFSPVCNLNYFPHCKRWTITNVFLVFVTDKELTENRTEKD